MLNGRCAVPDFEHESHESNESLTPRGGFVFPQISQIFTDF